MSASIQFWFQGQLRQTGPMSPTRNLLQHLREDLHCSAVKEGCAEGDCGACTVVTAELQNGELQMKSVNACLQLMPAIDGKAVFTAADLANGQQLHPVQQALVDCHASQCGFCTPGFVMSLWDLYLRREQADSPLDRRSIDIALSGNLCRCTGYRPIIDAARQMERMPRVSFDSRQLAGRLGLLQRQQSLSSQTAQQRLDIPRSLAELLQLRAEYPAAILLAGGTDIGLWVNKQMRQLNHIIYLGQVVELQTIHADQQHLSIGAAVTLEQAYQRIVGHFPELAELHQRFASLPIRHAGTLGGNLANGSPIGDSMPWLIAAAAEVQLQSSSGQRWLALENLYLGYQKKDLRADEILAAIRIPLRQPGMILRTYKLAKRFDQDISAVCAAFSARLDPDGRLSQVRIAFGGMAATPLRATQTEQTLEGQLWNQASCAAGTAALAADYAPLSDLRASADYRLTTAQGLLQRFWLETRPEQPLSQDQVNVFAAREAS